MRIRWVCPVLVAASAVADSQPIVSLPLRVENSVLVADGLSVNGKAFSFMLDFNSADVIVPICTGDQSVDQCFDPSKSGGFRYCAGESFCYDRQEPKFTCPRTVPASEWSLDTSALTLHRLVVDGIVTNATTFEFSDSVYANGGWSGTVPIKGAVDTRRAVLGLGPNRISCRSSTFSSELGSSFFQIDSESLSFYADVPTGIMFSKHYQLVPTNSSVMLGKYAFNMYHPTVCGTDILGNVSSHWSAIIDPTIECLVVPEFMLNNLKSWKSGSDGILYFSLTDENDIRTVAMDLSNVCLQSRPGSESDLDFGITGLRPIVLGRRALQALGILGFESVEPFRLGFTVADHGTPACSTPVSACVGWQTYHASSNSCVDPTCSDWLLREMDASSKTCVWKPYSTYLVYGTVFILIVGELALHKLRRKTLHIAQSSCQRDADTAT